MLRALLLCTLFTLLNLDPARAEWVLDGTFVGGRSPAYASAVVTDGSGGVIIVWTELRANDYDLYARRVDAAGNPLWTADGVAICTAIGDQTNLATIADGVGGAIIVWQDARGVDENIYAQRVNSSGAVTWTANGVAICTQTGTQAGPVLISDGASGAIIVWQDARTGTSWDIYARRVNSAGTPQWTANGNAVCTLLSGQTAPELVADGIGGAIIGWSDFRNGGADVFAQRLNASGAAQWLANGLPVCIATGNQGSLRATADGTGGALFVWDDERNGPKDIYAQRINGSGAPVWPVDGRPVCTAINEQGSPEVVGDGSGGAIVSWIDFRNGVDLNIYAQRVNAFGTRLWTLDGVPLCLAADSQSGIALVSDGAGGAIAAWYDSRTGTEADVFARRVNANGLALWEYDGVPLCTAAYSQDHVYATSDGAGGVIVGWSDWRAGDPLIYAQRAEFRYGYWGRPEPTIKPAVDNPSDQGGKVIVRWAASQRDLYYMPGISHYSVWRSTDVSAFTAVTASGEKSIRDPRAVARNYAGVAVWKEETLAGPVYWEWVGNLNADYQPTYSYTAPTRQDSTVANPATTWFKIVAYEIDVQQGRVWESSSVSARSADNLAPAAPMLLAIRGSGSNAVLTWKPADDPDFAHYTLYRDDINGVRVLAGNFLTNATLPNYTDSGAGGGGYFYVVTAVDIHGNESTASNEVSLSGSTGVGDTPAITALALQPNFPNPFSTRTELNVGVPNGGSASLELFDIAGRMVVTKNLGPLQPGWQKVAFDARDDLGRPIASGIYFCRVSINGQRATSKLAIAR